MRKVLLITGASAGIGAQTARQAAAQGYDLALNYRGDRAGAQAVADAVIGTGAHCALCPADMSDPAQIEGLFAQIDQEFGRIDALVNNAGVVDRVDTVTGFTHDRLRRMFDINVIAPMLVAKEAVLRMRAHGSGGSIVNVSSAASRLGSANQFVDYAASKAAIDTFTKGLADEVAGDNIRVNAIRPGLIDTGLHAKAGDAGRADRLARGVPMRRTGSVQEVADGILFLLSDQSSYVTGTTLDVTGGR